MGCAQSNVDLDAVERSKQIDDDLAKDKKAKKKDLRLLLLGAGESGKSTLAKQMRLIHLHGFTDEERKAYIMPIHNNIYQSVRALLNATEMMKIETKFDKDFAKHFAPPTLQEPLTPELGTIISTIWNDPGIQEAFERRHEFQLIDSAPYYLDAISRIATEDYMPTDQDMLRSRVQTTGVIETELEVKGRKLILVDVGGQRAERKKWLGCFMDVTAVLFCVALSEFDQVLYEDSSVNRMHESLQLFREICGSKWFTNTAIILFLNKCDLFQEKIESGKSIKTAFPEYKGPNTYNDSTEYIKKKFTNITDPFTGKKREIYTHLTCATDTNNVRKVFQSVEDYVMNLNLSAAGF